MIKIGANYATCVNVNNCACASVKDVKAWQPVDLERREIYWSLLYANRTQFREKYVWFEAKFLLTKFTASIFGYWKRKIVRLCFVWSSKEIPIFFNLSDIQHQCYKSSISASQPRIPGCVLNHPFLPFWQPFVFMFSLDNDETSQIISFTNRKSISQRGNYFFQNLFQGQFFEIIKSLSIILLFFLFLPIYSTCKL